MKQGQGASLETIDAISITSGLNSTFSTFSNCQFNGCGDSYSHLIDVPWIRANFVF